MTWHPEFASYMLETTPGAPYGGSVKDFLHVEGNMRLRRTQAASVLPESSSLVTMTTFPRLGCPDFTYPPAAPAPDGGISNSLFFPDQAINNSHPRFATLARNIRQRRGRKVAMNVPSKTWRWQERGGYLGPRRGMTGEGLYGMGVKVEGMEGKRRTVNCTHSIRLLPILVASDRY